MSKNLRPENIYDDDSIRVLEGLKAVRERPGMYVGSSGSKGLHHLIWEILDNSVDEVLAGFADTVTLTLGPDHLIKISDNGRGIPVGINKQTNLSNLITVFTILHAGGKFENNAYKTSGGLHGVGATCVNALSSVFEVTVFRNGEEHYVKFVNGGQIEVQPSLVNTGISKTGTIISWKPDFSILEKNEYDISQIEEKMEQLAYLNKAKRFIFVNEISGETKEYIFEDGIKNWVNHLNKDKQVFHDIVVFSKSGEVKNRREILNSISVNFALQYTHESGTILHSFCNNINTVNGGTHLEAFKDGLLNCIRKRALEAKIIKNSYEIVKADVIAGLTAIISIYYSNPEYEGQTKGVLSNQEIKSFIRTETEANFNRFLEENIKEREVILKRVEQEFNLRAKIEIARQSNRQLSLEGFLSFAGKLADCSMKSIEFSELYIVEGDSAGGSAKSARNREFQAILPIKGKLINVQKNNKLQIILNNKEIKNLISAIGCSHSENFDLSKLRYNKIILMTDADVDGAHIRVLLLTFIYRYMKDLVDKGHIYIAQPPLYRASSNKNVQYIFDDRELKNFKKNTSNINSFEISRFKGLGEMSPEQLWETTMNPKKRLLLRINIEDAKAAEVAFNELMGEKVEPRKKFILQNYQNTKNLDI